MRRFAAVRMSPSNRPVGSSTFRLSTAAVSMSLAGSCFSPELAPRPALKGPSGRNSEYHMQQIVVVQFAYPLGPGDC